MLTPVLHNLAGNFFCKRWLPVYQLWMLPRVFFYTLLNEKTCVWMKTQLPCNLVLRTRLLYLVGWLAEMNGVRPALLWDTLPHTGEQWVSLAGQGMPPMSAFSPALSFLSCPCVKGTQHIIWVHKALVKGGGAHCWMGRGDLMLGKLRCCGQTRGSCLLLPAAFENVML